MINYGSLYRVFIRNCQRHTAVFKCSLHGLFKKGYNGNEQTIYSVDIGFFPMSKNASSECLTEATTMYLNTLLYLQEDLQP
jgi:hypothetical protein